MSDISKALFGNARRGVLIVLFGHPSEEFYSRQIIRLVGTGQGAVQRELDRLYKAGLITRIKRGNQVYYQADPTCPACAELIGLMAKTTGEADSLAAALRPLADTIKFAFIHGPFAGGAKEPGSAIDILVIGTAGLEQVAQKLHQVERRLDRKLNITVMGQSEFRNKAATANQFVYSVLRGKKIFLLGDERQLERY